MGSEKSIQVTVSEDKMSAWIILEDNNSWSLISVKEALKKHGVVFGISDVAIRTCLLSNESIPYQVAWGLPPHDEQPGKGVIPPRIVLKFGQFHGKPPDSLKVGPNFRDEWKKILARGVVRAGGILAFIRNFDKCSVGLTVTGEKIPYFVRKPFLRYGPNSSPSKDGKYIIASASGVPYVCNQIPGIMTQFEVIGNIGPETGNIAFPGNLTVKGDVLQGFQVSSWGSLIVMGNLSGSASCAGTIAVEGGINAPGEIVESGGTVSARFCENSVVRAYGDVAIAESIMHSVVETERELKLSKGRGRIVGGLIRAGIGASTYSAGSTMGISTVVEVGASPKMRRELVRLKKEISALNAEINRIKRAGIRRSTKLDQLQLDNLRLHRMGVLFEDREKELYARLASLEDSIKKSGKGYFRAELVLPGTIVVAGLDTIEFPSLEHNVEVGVRRNETN